MDLPLGHSNRLTAKETHIVPKKSESKETSVGTVSGAAWLEFGSFVLKPYDRLFKSLLGCGQRRRSVWLPLFNFGLLDGLGW